DLSMTVEKGEIFGLLGPNGAGKTTTIKILMGIHFATAGTARILGKPLGDREAKKRIGYLPENPYFYDYLRGWEFLDFYGHLYGMPKAKRRNKIEELLALVGLSHAANLPLRGYSKGMNQRIGLAQTLLNDPDLVFLDEPQSGLDPLGRKDVRDLILSLRDKGHTVFFSSHILQDAELICDRVAILNKGKLRAIGHLADLLSEKVKEWELVIEGVDEKQLDVWKPRIKKLVHSKEQHLAIVEEEALANEIIRETLNRGGKLISLTPRKETLEQYFITEVTGKAPAS
ncbi:ABC transporter ATP-binding protein, partial [Candidatus Sumerlaeota bacterium]|nr:ABC transporter ATP-binding protein [Candidatus Sumerlaeota bacterium]